MMDPIIHPDPRVRVCFSSTKAYTSNNRSQPLDYRLVLIGRRREQREK